MLPRRDHRREAPLSRHRSPKTGAEPKARAFLSREEPAQRAGKNVLAEGAAQVTARRRRHPGAGTHRPELRLTNGGKSPPC